MREQLRQAIGNFLLRHGVNNLNHILGMIEVSDEFNTVIKYRFNCANNNYTRAIACMLLLLQRPEVTMLGFYVKFDLPSDMKLRGGILEDNESTNNNFNTLINIFNTTNININ